MSNTRAKSAYHYATLIVIVTLAVTLCYPALIDTAAVHSEKQLQRIVFRNHRNVRFPRAMEDSDEENGGKEDEEKRICYNAPCGWVVYNPQTRDIEYFMKNPCVCPDESYKCVRAGEDLSASAYVYRCRQNTTADDIESPTSPDDGN